VRAVRLTERDARRVLDRLADVRLVLLALSGGLRMVAVDASI
jgi:hypothetical protein